MTDRFTPPLPAAQVAQIALTIADVLWAVNAQANTASERARCAVATALRRGFPGNDACHLPHEAARREAEGCAAAAAPKTKLTAADVEWVVNDIAELGVKIGDQFFWLYKGESLIYDPPIHDDQDGRPMLWRHVYKREFGECCHPINRDDPTKIGTVDVNDGGDWLPIDAGFASNSPNNLRKPDAPPPPAPDLVQQLRGYHSSRADYPAWTLCHEAADAIEALRAERDALLSDWNAMVLAIGASKHGTAIAHAAALKARAEAAEADAKRLREALQNLAYYECYTREGEEPPHVRMMQEARAALAQGGNDDQAK